MESSQSQTPIVMRDISSERPHETIAKGLERDNSGFSPGWANDFHIENAIHIREAAWTSGKRKGVK